MNNKKVKDMLRPEVVMYVHSYQNVLFKEESSLIDIKNMKDQELYDVAQKIEDKLVSGGAEE